MIDSVRSKQTVLELPLFALEILMICSTSLWTVSSKLRFGSSRFRMSRLLLSCLPFRRVFPSLLDTISTRLSASRLQGPETSRTSSRYRYLCNRIHRNIKSISKCLAFWCSGFKLLSKPSSSRTFYAPSTRLAGFWHPPETPLTPLVSCYPGLNTSDFHSSSWI